MRLSTGGSRVSRSLKRLHRRERPLPQTWDLHTLPPLLCTSDLNTLPPPPDMGLGYPNPILLVITGELFKLVDWRTYLPLMVLTPRPPQAYGWQEGSTHPTGRLSCFRFIYLLFTQGTFGRTGTDFPFLYTPEGCSGQHKF